MTAVTIAWGMYKIGNSVSRDDDMRKFTRKERNVVINIIDKMNNIEYREEVINLFNKNWFVYD